MIFCSLHLAKCPSYMISLSPPQFVFSKNSEPKHGEYWEKTSDQTRLCTGVICGMLQGSSNCAARVAQSGAQSSCYELLWAASLGSRILSLYWRVHCPPAPAAARAANLEFKRTKLMPSLMWIVFSLSDNRYRRYWPPPARTLGSQGLIRKLGYCRDNVSILSYAGSFYWFHTGFSAKTKFQPCKCLICKTLRIFQPCANIISDFKGEALLPMRRYRVLCCLCSMRGVSVGTSAV